MKNKQRLLKEFIRRQTAANKGMLTLMVILIAGSIIASLLPPIILEQIVNRLSARQTVSLGLALCYFAFIVAADILETLQNAAITVFGQRMTHGIRSALCAKLSRLPSEYFHTHKAGEMASVFTNDGDAIDVLYSDGVVSMFADCFRLIAILAVIFTRSAGLGLLLLVAAPLLFLFTRWSQKTSKQAQLDNRRAIARVNSHVPETIRCLRMIHNFHAEKHMENTYDGYIRESYDAVDRSNIIDSIYSPVILASQAAVTAIMMIFAASGSQYRALFGISVGSAVALISYVGSIFSPLENIGMEIQNIQAAGAAITHIEDFLAETEWQKSGSEPSDSQNVSFSHVSFAYEAGRPVLQDLSFTIRPGENVTFAGRTGAGKSTIFHLLCGLYEPDAGTVSLLGKNPCLLSEDEKRHLFGLVEQQFTAVPGSIRDQITLYDPSCSDADIREALTVTGLTDVVEALPDGLDAGMDEKLFSKGQLQLLSIARAIVCHPKVLLLDEITANLDADTEASVIRALQTSARGRTVISISHRLAQSIDKTRIIEIR
ncbi:MAG: ABC transporter ATP-binding protein [Lachnospiraceae bacterium]|nr:ABC transporter ATP-binding protein [Lachnospiraceae bacterium]